ncbi:MAG TPA: YggT family protein [Dermatophilaceae bacterium]|nr:YggT family protein [Dermatophilaceae bacterium]
MLGVVIIALLFVLNLFFAALICRLVLDWIQVLAREWRPRGPMLFFAEAVYTVTDPPLKFLRRLIPPLSLGSVRLDMGFLVLILAVSMTTSLLRSL